MLNSFGKFQLNNHPNASFWVPFQVQKRLGWMLLATQRARSTKFVMKLPREAETRSS